MTKIKKCPSCQTNQAIIDPKYGITWCKKCRKKNKGDLSKTLWPEFIPDYIKEDRVKHAKDTVQPWRQGEPSREYIKLYPEQAKKTFTPEQIKNAKDVWRDVKNLKDIQEVR